MQLSSGLSLAAIARLLALFSRAFHSTAIPFENPAWSCRLVASNQCSIRYTVRIPPPFGSIGYPGPLPDLRSRLAISGDWRAGHPLINSRCWVLSVQVSSTPSHAIVLGLTSTTRLIPLLHHKWPSSVASYCSLEADHYIIQSLITCTVLFLPLSSFATFTLPLPFLPYMPHALTLS
ncbi:hypothetical protein BDZ97DRAFT_572756 [Flammula alnicola]|nr:hypothetical protein BDZ97DRAFT_572756 [Flammula alnicola]